MDIAAGNGGGSGVAGFAPQADLVFVDVSHSDIPFTGSGVVGSHFGDSTQLLEAVTYILDQAGTRPCVINISLGTNGGPHDGSTLVEEGIDRLLEAAPNRAVTIAASNSFDDGIHAQGTVAQGGHTDLVWQIPFGDDSHNELELWYAGNERITMELITPTGRSLGTVAPGNNGTITDSGQIVVFAANRIGDPNNGDNMIGLFFEQMVMSGNWTVRLHGDNVTTGAFHAWIERDNVLASSFAPPHDNSHTIGSISCGRQSIVVGSYDAHKSNRPISFFSSAGPTRDGRQKPEISAPGHGVFAAHSRTGTGVIRKNGTSMAAPGVAGIIALVLGEARARSLDLTIADIRDIVAASARRSPPSGSAWHARYGLGRIDAAAVVADVIQRAGGGPGTPASGGGAGASSRSAASRKPGRKAKPAAGRRKKAKA